MYHLKTKEDPGLSIGNDAKKLGEMWVTALQMAGSLKRRLLWKEKYQKDSPEPKEGCYGKKKKKMMSRLIQTRGKKKKEEKDKEGEINEEQEDKDNKVEDNN